MADVYARFSPVDDGPAIAMTCRDNLGFRLVRTIR
jgi:hypothetical protein